MASPLLFQGCRSEVGADRGLAGAWCSSPASAPNKSAETRASMRKGESAQGSAKLSALVLAGGSALADLQVAHSRRPPSRPRRRCRPRPGPRAGSGRRRQRRGRRRHARRPGDPAPGRCVGCSAKRSTPLIVDRPAERGSLAGDPAGRQPSARRPAPSSVLEDIPLRFACRQTSFGHSTGWLANSRAAFVSSAADGARPAVSERR